MDNNELKELNINEEPKKKSTWKTFVIDLAAAFLIAQLVLTFVRPTVVVDTSMAPNFLDGDYLLLSTKAYAGDKTPEKGDVIVFQSDLETKDGDKKLLIKRVIGLPGDTIDIKDGKVYINGKEDDQSYTNDNETNGDIKDHVVPEGCVFCMGDNRLVSIDSRDSEVGDVDMKLVMGKVIFRLYRFGEIGTIHNPYSETK